MPYHCFDLLYTLVLRVTDPLAYLAWLLLYVLAHGENHGRHLTILLGMPWDLTS